AVHPPGERLERLLRRLELARRDREQAVDWHRKTFVELQLLLELVASEPKRCTRTRSDLRFQVFQVRTDGLGGFGLRVGEIAEQMQVVDAGEGARQISLYELQRSAHRLDTDLDEDTWG